VKRTDAMGVDQYGATYHALGAHPRRELLRRLGRSHAEKMYVGDGEHIGYVIAGRWIALYAVEPWPLERAA
jgi:hypothetical protein